MNYRTLHVKQPDVASGVRPEMKPLCVQYHIIPFWHFISDQPLLFSRFVTLGSLNDEIELRM